MNSLVNLSDVELVNSMRKHVNNERASLNFIYQHINEVYRRGWHLDSAYGDMKSYLVKFWNYSERDAYRKIDGARLLRDVPALTNEIQNGNLNADVIGEISRAIKEKERTSGEVISAAQKTELVQMVSGKTAMETQRELAQALDIEIKTFEKKRVQKDQYVRLELGVSAEIYAKLMTCRNHASHKIQQEHLPHNLESLLKVLAEYYIKGHKLDGTEATSNKTLVQRPTSTRSTQDAPVNPMADQKVKQPNKTITSKTRREVFARDKGCQFKNVSTGHLCGSNFMPQVDHKTSLWAGGTNEMSNLQQLCANHNQRKYRKEAQLSWLQ